MNKTIDSIQYHVWLDALHARELARQTQSEWDRGAYVRWAIQTAWSAFENVCADALEISGLGMRFKEEFNKGIAKKGLEPVHWGKGIWNEVLQVYKKRKDFVHVVPSISHEKLLASVDEADQVIAVLRNAMRALLDLVGLRHPAWINDDADRGWKGTGKIETFAHGTVIRAGADENDPEAIRITYVSEGEEHLSEIAPPDTAYGPVLDRMLSSLNSPVEAVRAYRGIELLDERKLNLR
jgi:hypothetical protein